MVCRKWNEKEKKEKKRIIRGRACCLEERAKVGDIHNKTKSSMCCLTRTKRKED
jgi:hypothetical protein